MALAGLPLCRTATENNVQAPFRNAAERQWRTRKFQGIFQKREECGIGLFNGDHVGQSFRVFLGKNRMAGVPAHCFRYSFPIENALPAGAPTFQYADCA